MRTAVAAGKDPERKHEWCLSCGSRITALRGRVVACRNCWTVYYMPAAELIKRSKGI